MNFGFYTSTYLDSLFDNDLGSPMDPHYMIEGTHVYARDFSEIKVLVNPTNMPYSITLDGNYMTFDGLATVSTFNIGPHSGMILKKSTDNSQ